MTPQPEHSDFVRRLRALASHSLVKPRLKRGVLDLKSLSEAEIDVLCRDSNDAPFYFLMAAANLSRTKLKAEMNHAAVKIAPKKLRRAYALKRNLPPTCSFDAIVTAAAALRVPDIDRKDSGDVERILRERLVSESIPVLMAPPIRGVPGVLTRAKRKPDGVFPDPTDGAPPRIYLEIKRVNRVSDDIQKRLYEIAEVSLEMKALYGTLQLAGLNLQTTSNVLGNAEVRSRLREQIKRSLPVVVALLICSRDDAQPYRDGAEALIDRVFFQEEIEECIAFLRSKCVELA